MVLLFVFSEIMIIYQHYQQNYKLMSNKTLVRNYKSLSKTQKMWIFTEKNAPFISLK